jgi:hypothetical protein
LSEMHFSGTISDEYASISSDKIASMIRSVAMAGPDIIPIKRTNMQGAVVAAELEFELGMLSLTAPF